MLKHVLVLVGIYFLINPVWLICIISGRTFANQLIFDLDQIRKKISENKDISRRKHQWQSLEELMINLLKCLLTVGVIEEWVTAAMDGVLRGAGVGVCGL